MSSDDGFFEAAAAIGRRIVDAAVWYDGRCSWVGAAAGSQRPSRVQYRALGPSVYDGTAGVGLFLAQLAAVTGETRAARTAVGSLRHAVEQAPTLRSADFDGLQLGAVGVVLAAVRAAVLLEEEELDGRARGLLGEMRLPAGDRRCSDLISGSAGAVIGLLALARALEDARIVIRAVETGEELLDQATVTQHGWSWATPGRRYPHHLCGLSHGASGIGWALSELFAATGDARFRDAAAGAFAYERSWLNTVSGTWPDLRVRGLRREEPQPTVSPATGTWCHGEAGIALTRLQASALLDSDAVRRDALIALETTRRHLSSLLRYGIEDLSLCHGAAGSADALLCGDERSREPVDLGHLALERYGLDGDRWPCGIPSATTPGLFLGLSGIAWWFMRLHDRRCPSPLGTWGLTRSVRRA